MSAKKCARCDKGVYPIEELKCLDKVWHKGCFKCQECGMSLNMNNYKGFNKFPYCNAHCPQARATTVADTPEIRRLAENTRLQSQVKYHAEFEKAKGKLTQIADDPETVRIRNASKIISNASYHGEYERKKQMEEKRTLMPEEEEQLAAQAAHAKNGFGSAAGHGQPKVVQINVPQQQQQHQTRQIIMDGNMNKNANVTSMHAQQHQIMQQQQQQQLILQQQQRRNESANTNHINIIRNSGDNNQYQKNLVSHNIEPQFQQQHHQQQLQHQRIISNAQQQQQQYHGNSNINKESSPYSSKLQSTIIYTSEQGPVNENPSKKVGSIQDYDPLNHNYGSIAGTVHGGGYFGGASQAQVMTSASPMRRSLTRTFKAIYDYTAQDLDEVSFIDGDMIINCQPIDEGWMTGTVQRTGQSGMLPSNYVEAFN